MTENTQPSVNNDQFAFFCPECNSLKSMDKADIGKIIECEECFEMVTIDYPEIRPCPKCKKSIKLKAKVCKYCKQRVIPFIDPFERETVGKPAKPPTVSKTKIDPRIKVITNTLLGMAGGFVIGLFGTRAIARITQRCITSNADYIVAAVLGLYLAIRIYRSKRNQA